MSANFSPSFPDVFWSKGRGYIARSKLDKYKAELQAASLGVPPVYPPAPQPDPFVPLKQVGVELGIGRRSVGRRIRESQVAEEAAAEQAADAEQAA